MLCMPPSYRWALWDTWLFADKGTFYLFSLNWEPDGVRFDSFRLAISTDLVHWEDRGVILHMEPGLDSIGTGHTWKVGDTYVLNYCANKDGLQSIRFATSKDLLHWTRLGDAYESFPDERWYQVGLDHCATGHPRWDGIYVLPSEDGNGYIGYLTATANDGPLARRGVAGCVRSTDGLKFAAAPPVTEPGLSCQIEVGGVAKIGSHWYMACSFPQSILGERNAWRDTGIGTQYLVAKSQTGPFRLPSGNNRLLSASERWSYFGRFFSHEGTVLFNHHSLVARDVNGTPLTEDGITFAPVKEVRETAPGRIALFYWQGNDALRGDRFDSPQKDLRPVFSGSVDPCAWHFGTDSIVADAQGTGGITCHELDEESAAAGIVADVRVALDGENGAAGVFLGFSDRAGFALMLRADGTVEVGGMYWAPWAWGFSPRDTQTDCVAPGKEHQMKVLARASFVELYVDGRLAQVVSMPRRFRGVGLIADDCRATFSDLTVWRMTLDPLMTSAGEAV